MILSENRRVYFSIDKQLWNSKNNVQFRCITIVIMSNGSFARMSWVSSWYETYHTSWHTVLYLTHWDRDTMAAISQMTLWNAFSWMQMLESLLKFHWSLFRMVRILWTSSSLILTFIPISFVQNIVANSNAIESASVHSAPDETYISKNDTCINTRFGCQIVKSSFLWKPP